MYLRVTTYIWDLEYYSISILPLIYYYEFFFFFVNSCNDDHWTYVNQYRLYRNIE